MLDGTNEITKEIMKMIKSNGTFNGLQTPSEQCPNGVVWLFGGYVYFQVNKSMSTFVVYSKECSAFGPKN
jgi:hypothetical protein